MVSMVSRNDNFCIGDESRNAFVKNFPGSSISLTPDNSTNITVINNIMIKKSISEGYDYLIMMHSDVELDLVGLAHHIMECANKYDVMGLCGCEKISISESPLNWFCGSRKFPEYRWGCVSHGELGNQISFFSERRPEVRDHSVACIDGLCIIMSRKAMESGLMFDEELKFNCYDTQISFDAVMNKGLRLGCLVERDLKHFSVGKSILKDEFMEEELVLRRRFGFCIPPDSRLANYLASKNKTV